jgi:hypothetical protein
MIKTFALGLLATAAVAAPAFAAESPRLQIEHAAARVVVIPEARGDIAYTVDAGRSGLPAIQVRREGDKLILDGGLKAAFGRSRIRGCDSYGASHVVDDRTVWSLDLGKSVRIDGIGSVKVADLPVITVHVPLDARIAAGDAVFGEIGPSNSLSLGDGGCGDWKVATVKGLAHVGIGGSGAVHLASAGQADIDIGGTGNVFLTAASGLHANIGGSGNVKVGSVNGPVVANIGGSGNVVVESGATPKISANIAGSGNVTFRGVAGSVAASIVGSGDVNVREVTGAVSKTVMGSGGVRIGR